MTNNKQNNKNVTLRITLITLTDIVSFMFNQHSENSGP